jgi:Zinc knuckle
VTTLRAPAVYVTSEVARRNDLRLDRVGDRRVGPLSCLCAFTHYRTEKEIKVAIYNNQRPPVALPLLDATREVSRAAHRWRDAASRQYEAHNFGLATFASSTKNALYELKERGIVAAHAQGLLRYCGQTPQGMALYEYGEGGKACFHSCLHPAGAKRRLLSDHPEMLFVPPKKRSFRVSDAIRTLSALPLPGDGYKRSAAPSRRKAAREVICWECGETGHIASECPEREDDWEYEYAIG